MNIGKPVASPYTSEDELTASDNTWDDLQRTLQGRWANTGSNRKGKISTDGRREKRGQACVTLDWPAMSNSLGQFAGVAPSSKPLAGATQQCVFLCGGFPRANKRQRANWPEHFDWSSAAAQFCELPRDSNVINVQALLWAYALPRLTAQLDEASWWKVLDVLNQLRQRAAELPDHSSIRMLLVGELSLALAWGLQDLPSARRMQQHGLSAYKDFLYAADASRGDALTQSPPGASHGANSTLGLGNTLAATLRCETLGRCVFGDKLSRSLKAEIHELAQWAAHLTQWGGQHAMRVGPEVPGEDMNFSDAIERAAEITGDDGLVLAMQFANRTADKSLRNKLTVEMDLPESGLYCDQSLTFSLRQSWFDNHAWLLGNFQSRHEPRIQLATGKRWIIDGPWTVQIQVGQHQATPMDDWQEVCWHSDDDVHYVELEQAFTRGVTVQRHMLLLREDGVVLMGDSVFADANDADANDGDTVASDAAAGNSRNRNADVDAVDKPAQCPAREISYQCELSFPESLHARCDQKTRETTLGDKKPRAMVLPLGLPEWLTGPSCGHFESDGNRLRLSMRGQRRLYASLWFDLQSHRFDWPRTWRRLTVANNLRICDPSEAVASRIQMGSQQWVVYRELGAHAARTFCGKHLAADFYCGRFDPEDGTMESLLTLENQTSST